MTEKISFGPKCHGCLFLFVVMKLMIRNCPTHGLNLSMIIQMFYAGLNFASRNLLDSVAGGTFMEIALGEATILLDNIMANYSQWHTERSSTSKKSACD